jgi:hypothetical protein
LALQSFVFDLTWWRLFKDLVVHIKLEIYVYIYYIWYFIYIL